MRHVLASLLLGASFAAHAQTSAIAHMEPPFWWAGMQHKELQLMVHGERIAELEPSLSYPGVRIASVTRVPNKNYLFIDLVVGADARPGSFEIRFAGAGGRSASYNYRLLAREPGSANRAGFSSKDAIYQIMPDRFANGDPSNDSTPDMLEKGDRKNGGGRHGGDIAGIIGKLDYIAGLGFTQLWPTPLVENNMPSYSYHGYAATDHYRIDPRYGSNEDFVRLSREAKQRGIGIIQDVVLSHIGSHHWWMKDLPTPDWVNYGKFVPTQHHRTAVQDPYASQEDSDNFTRGWFVQSMPDLNQSNPLVANYLIQNNIWWIEYAGLSGLRIDTFGYSDGAFLSQYTKRLMQEYPKLNLVGEEWSTKVPVVARWQRGKQNFDGYTASTPSLMDFPLSEAMRNALADKEGRNVFNEVYETLSLDYLYPEPGNLVLFADNHDMSRIYSVVGEDLDKYKMDLVFIMTMPRIPQFYVGDEILMTSATKERNDISYRSDFPGGWAGDRIDAFAGKGLTARQREAQEFVRKLVNWRKGQPVIHHGKLMHYGPRDNTYVYFRYDGSKKVLVAFNNNPKEMVLDVDRFREMLSGVASGKDVLSGKTFDLRSELRLPAKASLVLELQ
ncbi:alpha-amlyase [Massilia sp. KIM]|uniref:glycoside hydrolase family 13 protein n=1 Tax=Massilia sp. KIM TaxID=1955422 RepID=UPI00099002E5|nr:glycoside hydrolase family 13 protein [Massilia sp. KIM]OON61301.1 alpha-amlyase [Massilia sp. KIM]